ncbi:MAG TPA: YebC/PmpR family DNA-binding transcriptional regulator [Mycobacteriales bacterium]|nr:YebC/PmpR family DNA-binding transcriptional regulator [Mycobacteriales bacterium]
MSGHSKWATTKHKKAAIDAKRGKLFAKLIKTIEVAARTGGGDPSGNPTLADAIAKAKGQSVPNDNIDRAVKRGSGELGEGVNYEEITYEAYGPGGTAFLIECLTDNRNRANAEVRIAITRNGGNPADPGSVAYLFNRKGTVLIAKADGLTEDDVLMAVLDAGAEEVNDQEDAFEVVCDAPDTHAVRTACAEAGLTVESAEVIWAPSLTNQLEDDVARKVLKLVDALEDLDDVQNVYANFDVSDEVLESV